jgi:hypothetical protein
MSENNNKNKCSSICDKTTSTYEQYLNCLKENNKTLKLEVDNERLRLEAENERLEKELKNLKVQRQEGKNCPESSYELETPLHSQLLTKIKVVVKELLVKNDDNQLQAQMEVPPKK